jgi:hypothetical protein
MFPSVSVSISMFFVFSSCFLMNPAHYHRCYNESRLPSTSIVASYVISLHISEFILIFFPHLPHIVPFGYVSELLEQTGLLYSRDALLRTVLNGIYIYFEFITIADHKPTRFSTLQTLRGTNCIYSPTTPSPSLSSIYYISFLLELSRPRNYTFMNSVNI